MASINRVILVGNLTRDPELKQLPSGTNVCSLRLAVHDRVKDRDTGDWVEYSNFFDIDVFGGQAESCARFLSKGRQVAIEGKLRWRQWETQDGQKRSKVSVVADNVQFIGPREGGAQGGAQGGARGSSGAPIDPAPIDVATDGGFEGDEGIPF
jgi:single-strand DNA-binding protein